MLSGLDEQRDVAVTQVMEVHALQARFNRCGAHVYRIAVEGSGDDGIAYPVAEIRSSGYAMGLVYFELSAEEARERQRQSG
jgi:hypothetical protein